jgi:AcrR family transcriptional regulator
MAYHHGNAREALIEAAVALLVKDGAAGLSLRQVAERAGLSRQAPYNHFADKEALMAELVRDGFERLGTTIRDTPTDGSPLDRLTAAAECYITFGRREPALFRLMFSKELVDRARHVAAQHAASAALGQLSAIICALKPAADSADATLVAWSLVHGYTTLCNEAGLEKDTETHARAVLFAQTVATLIGNGATTRL